MMEIFRNGMVTRSFAFVAVIGAIFYISLLLLKGGAEDKANILISSHELNEQTKVHIVFSHSTEKPSLAHYTEHLAWLNAIGGERDADRHSNAWTNSYSVGYWLSGQPDDLPELLGQLKGVLDPIDLPESFAAEERDIVLREYEFRLAGNPSAQAVEDMDAFLYAGNAIAQSVIGTPEDIEAFTYDDAKALHAATHRPENATLIVTGDVSRWQLGRALRQSDWPDTTANNAKLVPPPFDLGAPERLILQTPDENAASRIIWRRVIALQEPVQFDPLEAQTALLRDILDTSLPGGIAGPLRNDNAVVRSYDLSIWPIDEDNIEIAFSAAPDRGVSLADVEKAFEATLSEIAAAGIPEVTYDRVSNRFDDFWPDWNDSAETASWMANYVVDRVSVQRQPLDERELERLETNLTLETTNALLRQINQDGRTAIAYIGPEDRFE